MTDSIKTKIKILIKSLKRDLGSDYDLNCTSYIRKLNAVKKELSAKGHGWVKHLDKIVDSSDDTDEELTERIIEQLEEILTYLEDDTPIENDHTKTNFAQPSTVINVHKLNNINGNVSTLGNSKQYTNSPHIEKAKIENVNINYGQQVNNQSVSYEGDRQNVVIYELFSPILVKKFGERKLGIAGIISLVVGVIQLLIWANSLASIKIFTYLPSVSANIRTWFLVIGIVLFILGAFLLGVISYFKDSKCQKCGRLFAYYEHANPEVTEVKVHNGVRITTKHKYQCKYCGDIKTTSETDFEESDKKIR